MIHEFFKCIYSPFRSANFELIKIGSRHNIMMSMKYSGVGITKNVNKLKCLQFYVKGDNVQIYYLCPK